MHTLLNSCRAERSAYVPPGFFRNGWNAFLPRGACSLVLSISTHIVRGSTEEEVCEKVTCEAENLFCAPFNFQFPSKFHSQEEKAIFFKIHDREARVSMTLERSGIGYPKSVRQVMDLFLQAGILIRTNVDNEIYLDMVIEPFPFPEDVLRLTPDEKYQVLHYRQQRTKSARNQLQQV